MEKLKTNPFADLHVIRFYDEFFGSYLFKDAHNQFYFANFADYQNNPEIETYVYLPITKKQVHQFEHDQVSTLQLYKSCKDKPIYINKFFTDPHHPDELYQASLAEIDKEWLPDSDSYL